MAVGVPVCELEAILLDELRDQPGFDDVIVGVSIAGRDGAGSNWSSQLILRPGITAASDWERRRIAATKCCAVTTICCARIERVCANQ